MTKQLLILFAFSLIVSNVFAQSANTTLNTYAGSSSTKYCYSVVGTCGFYYYIDSVHLDKYSKATLCTYSSSKSPSYYHATDTQNYVIGNTYSLNVRLSGYGTTYMFAAWADFNHNYSFADTGEFIFKDTPSSNIITIPLKLLSTYKPGKTRLRLMFVNYPTSPLTSSDACDSNKNYYGEVVDLDINIVASTGTNSIFRLTDYNIKCIPNPSQNSTNIFYTLPEGIEQGHLKVYTLLGVEVKDIAVSHSKTYSTITTSELPAGTYVYKLQTALGYSEGKPLYIIH